MKQNYLAKILKVMIYGTAIVPLVIFSQFISPFHFGKVVVFRSLVELMIPLYLLLIWRDRSYRPKFNIFFWAFALFTAAFTITTLTSVQIYQSFWGTLERMGGLWTFWHYLIFYLILISVFRTKEDWFKLLNLTVFVGILSALYGFGQKTNIEFFIGSGGRARIFGTIGNAALFAGYQILVLFLAVTLRLRPQVSNKERNLYNIAIALTAVAILMTAVRGSMLALVVGFVVFAFIRLLSVNSKKAKKLFFGLVTSVALFVMLALILKDSSFVQNSGYLRRITDFSPQTFTVQTRFWAWEAGIKGWAESPKTMLFGWGPENFNIPFSKNFNPRFFNGPGSETLFDRAHNMFVEVFVTMGIVGILSYLGMFVVIFWFLWKLMRKSELAFYSAGLIPLVIAYIIHNSFIFDTSSNFIVFFTTLAFISFLKEHSSGQAPTPGQMLNLRPGHKLVTAALLLAALVLVYKTNILTTKANYATTRAIVRGWSNDINGSIEKYKESLTYDVPGKYEYRHRAAQYLLELANKGKVSSDLAVAINWGIEEVKKNAADFPIDYLPQLYLSRLYIMLGKEDPASPYNDTALSYSMKALELSPTFVRTYYEIAQAYLNKKDYPKAVEYFEKAIELNPRVGLSYWYLSLIELELGNTQKGVELIDKALANNYTPSENDYLRLATLYYKLQNFAKVAEMYEKAISISPKNPQYYASLAVAYAYSGQIDAAVTAAKKAAELDPQFEAEARGFVQSLGRQW